MTFANPTPYERSYNSTHRIAATGEDQRQYTSEETFYYLCSNPSEIYGGFGNDPAKIKGNILNYRIFWEDVFNVLENYITQNDLIKAYNATVKAMAQYMNTDQEEADALKDKSFKLFSNPDKINANMNIKAYATFIEYVKKIYEQNRAAGKKVHPKLKAYAKASPTKSPVESKLMDCPDCGHEVSKRAKTCPHCGCPLRE